MRRRYFGALRFDLGFAAADGCRCCNQLTTGTMSVMAMLRQQSPGSRLPCPPQPRTILNLPLSMKPIPLMNSDVRATSHGTRDGVALVGGKPEEAKKLAARPSVKRRCEGLGLFPLRQRQQFVHDLLQSLRPPFCGGSLASWRIPGPQVSGICRSNSIDFFSQFLDSFGDQSRHG